MGKLTLFTITGLKARLLKVIFGTPFVGIGGLIVYARFGQFDVECVVISFIGGIIARFGLSLYGSAMENDELAVTLGGGSSQGHE